MSDKKDDCSTGSCSKNKDGQRLVKSTELPLTGNPYPPKDVIQNEDPSSLERSIASVRIAIKPYLSPVGDVYSRASDVVSIGVAHSQSAFQNLSENQNSLTSGLIISGFTIFGLLLARRKGFLKKVLYTSTFFTSSAAFCYQDAAKNYLEIGWVMAKKNLPVLVSDQYKKLSGKMSNSEEQSNISEKKD